MRFATSAEVTSTKLAALVLLMFCAFVGCGVTLEDGSESHFSRCRVDSDCITVGQACVAGYCQTKASAASDSGLREGSVAADGGLPDVSECAVNANLGHVSNLESFCAALASGQYGYTFRCPTNRDELLGTIPSWCGARSSSGTYFYPQFYRGCGLDIVFLDFSTDRKEFYFDSSTGALVGGTFQLGSPSFTCMDYLGWWRVGEQPDPTCSSSIESIGLGTASSGCDLCVAEQGGCPVDITNKIPTTVCTPYLADAGTCSCGVTYYDLPKNGTACAGSGACASCTAESCTSTCVCMRDGVFRYRLTCP